MMRAPLLFLLFTRHAFAQNPTHEVPSEAELVARIKARVKDQMTHIPQYTCLETLQRFQKPAGRRAAVQPLDTVRLEVLFAGDKEFFSSPGTSEFKNSDPSKYISTGMIGTGVFAGFMQAIFASDVAIFDYADYRIETDLDGRRSARYDFHVPLTQSSYTLTIDGVTAKTAYQGTFWADPATYDLLRLDVKASDIPPILQTSSVANAVDFAPTRIGEVERWLPRGGTIMMEHNSGEQSIDHFTFTNCRSYQAESSVSFSDAEPTSAAPVNPVEPAKPARRAATAEVIPGGLTVRITLLSAFADRSAVGDPVEGKVVGNVMAHGAIIIPNGALAHGRIRLFQKPDGFDDYTAAGIEFEEIELAVGSVPFAAELQSGSSPVRGVGWKPPTKETEPGIWREAVVPRAPAVGIFFIRGGHFTIPPGIHMIWKTRTP
jgi:hypothetical protein